MMTDRKSDTNVLLITPPQGLWKGRAEKPWNSTQPLGLAYVAASVRAAGHPVRVIDAYSQGTPGDELHKQIRNFAPRIVGISALTPQWPDAQQAAGIVKGINRDILTVVGGPHVTALPEEAAGDPNVDVAVIGEGERAMRDICDAVAADTDLAQVAGIVLGRGGQPEFTAPRPRNTELDNLVFPAHDLLPEPSFYNPFPSWGRKGQFSSIISGRGCPYNCSFCDVTTQQGRKYRLRSAENVVDELVWLNQTFGVTMFSFRDASMICDRDRLMRMLALIRERRLDIVWTCNARANEIDPEMLAAMREAGCRRLQYGIEVGNAEMLRSIKKITREKVAEAVRQTRAARISAHGYFIFGFIEETAATIEETIEFARRLELDSASFAVMVPYPGTQEFERFRAGGLLLTEDWRQYSIMGRPVYRQPNVTSEELLRATHRAYRRFYLRPRIIGRHLRKMSSPWALREYVRAARKTFLN